MSAFSTSILDQLSNPDRDIFYELITSETVASCLAKDYFSLRPEEVDLIEGCISKYRNPSILDIGCCIGRHSRFALSCSAEAKVDIVEKDNALRMHTLGALRVRNAYEGIDAINTTYNIILMMGLGLGIFGNEAATKVGIKNVLSLLAPKGALLIEGGKSSSGSFTTQNFRIQYNSLKDEPFEWGYASFEWFSSLIEEIGGVRIASISPTTNGEGYFICEVIKD